MICHKFQKCQMKQNLLHHYTSKRPFLKIGMHITDYKGTLYLVNNRLLLTLAWNFKINQKYTAKYFLN